MVGYWGDECMQEMVRDRYMASHTSGARREGTSRWASIGAAHSGGQVDLVRHRGKHCRSRNGLSLVFLPSFQPSDSTSHVF